MSEPIIMDISNKRIGELMHELTWDVDGKYNKPMKFKRYAETVYLVSDEPREKG